MTKLKLKVTEEKLKEIKNKFEAAENNEVEIEFHNERDDFIEKWKIR
jgi:hypothetical protein